MSMRKESITNFLSFKLFNTNYNFQTAAYRLAEITNKKIIAMLIFYDKKKFRHNLYLSHPFDVGNPNNCIQDCLNFMEPHMCKYKNQFFHDIDKCFKVHVLTYPCMRCVTNTLHQCCLNNL